MRSNAVPLPNNTNDDHDVAAWLCRAIAEAEDLAQAKLAAALASRTIEGRPTILPMVAIDAGLPAVDADAAFAWLCGAGLASRSAYDGSRHVSIERGAGR